ncbi:M23 family metallopeptidase [Tepidiforma thermophila]|uniref:Peptidase M23-like protein n=1 Tax=Tepidiforma thermophila (strain KCTC 52669 / CGMCC 1.13589 / G233) TaxID=2761530 RepID=A0A2A9HFR9_TEPT2|nr:M23 family metallopeptidase [Tepidiforma thermophila]PFG73649.1 peptidase M23-like protein [Tepidiforma thermophila]
MGYRAGLAGRLALAALAGAAVLAGAACSAGADGTPEVTVRMVTPAGPAPTPTLPPGVSPTPLVPPELVVSTLEVYQAGAVLVSVTGDVIGGQVEFLGRKYPLTKGSQSQYTFVPVDTEDPPGEHALLVDVRMPNGTRGTLQATVRVLPTEWTVDYLEFTPEQTAALLDPQVVAEEQALLKSIYVKVTPQKLWSGPWLIPAQGALTARFGEQRSVNGSAPSGHHGGTDIGAPEGTPVVATNSGVVVLARELRVRGNMVVIDHGGGLYSGYAHLSSIAVAEGDRVEAGQLIGAVGNTGLSTGAHLHWEMAAHGILLDALRFTDGTNGF